MDSRLLVKSSASILPKPMRAQGAGTSSMPTFTHRDGRDYVSIITGPQHIRLGLRLAPASDPERAPSVVRQPAIGECDHGAIDEATLVSAVMNAVESVAEESGDVLAVREIVYVANDSPSYGMYAHGARLLARRWSDPSKKKRSGDARSRLLIVEDVFEAPGRGLIVVPGPPLDAFPSPTELSVRLERPDGKVLEATASLTIPFQTPPAVDPRYAVILRGPAKSDVPIGTEIWFVLADDGPRGRATG